MSNRRFLLFYPSKNGHKFLSLVKITGLLSYSCSSLSLVYLITWSYPVDDVFKVSDHLLIPEVRRECLCPLSQQLQDLGTKLAHFCLLLKKWKRFSVVYICDSLSKIKHDRKVSNLAKNHWLLTCRIQVCLNAFAVPVNFLCISLCMFRQELCICEWCSADRIEWALVQLLLFNAQLTHPGQQLRRRDEQTSAQQEGKHIGFLSKDRRRHSLRHCHYINKKHCGFL